MAARGVNPTALMASLARDTFNLGVDHHQNHLLGVRDEITQDFLLHLDNDTASLNSASSPKGAPFQSFNSSGSPRSAGHTGITQTSVIHTIATSTTDIGAITATATTTDTATAEDSISTFFDIDQLLSDYSPASPFSDLDYLSISPSLPSCVHTATNTCSNSPGSVIGSGFDFGGCDSYPTSAWELFAGHATSGGVLPNISTSDGSSPSSSTSPFVACFSFDNNLNSDNTTTTSTSTSTITPGVTDIYSPLDTSFLDMGKVNGKEMFSDFQLFPENVAPQSYHNHHQNHQNVNTSRGVSTAASTQIMTSRHATTASLISPTLSSVGDNFSSIPSISYTTTTTSKSTPTSRKRPTPTIPIEDSFHTPPPSSKMRKTTSSTSSPYMKDLDESTRARSQRSQSPSQIVASTDDTVALKRARNTLAARRYRQKRVERLEELEGLLAEAEREKERCKEEAVKWRMEAEKWRGRYEGIVVGGGGGQNARGSDGRE